MIPKLSKNLAGSDWLWAIVMRRKYVFKRDVSMFQNADRRG